MSNADIAAALLARCDSLNVGTPRLPVAMPDVAADPPADGQYLEVADFPNQPLWAGLSAGRIDQGLLQVTVVWPKGQGVLKARRAADGVLAHFPRDLILTSGAARVKIGVGWVAQPILDDFQTRTPVMIPWTAS